MVFEKLDPRIQNLLKEKGFDKPTNPQRHAIPLILEGKNVLIIGPTGHGKTEAALLPIFHQMLNSNIKPISLLYITPLKSLNRDMLSRIVWWARKLGFGVTVRHGDTTPHQRKLQVEHPDEIFIITPEQLQAMLTGKKIRDLLKNVRWIVVDELHELVESKRGVQLSVALERLKEIVSDKIQIVSLSATVSSPKETAKFIGCDEVVEAFDTKEYEIKVLYLKPSREDKILSEELLIDPSVISRLKFIKEKAEEYRSILVFTNTRETAEVLSSRLRMLYPDFPQEVHHSSLSRHVRETVEKQFREGKLKTILATSSLELGIDIGTIDCVIQYMSPRQVSKFLQRIGRSGHKIGRKSEGFILANDGDDLLESIAILDFSLRHKLEHTKLLHKNYDVLVSQIIGMLIEGYENEKEIFKVIKRAYPYRDLTYQEFEEILEMMKELRLITNNRKTRKGLLYYFENITTIPETFQYKVIDSLNNTVIGKLDEDWVVEYAVPGATFIVKGSPWKVVGIKDDKVYAEPSGDIDSAIPSWEGELIPVPYEITHKVGEIKRKISDFEKEEDAIEFLLKNYRINEDGAKEIVKTIFKHKKKHPVPDDKTIVFENNSEFIVIHTHFGSKVNETLSKFISSVLSAEYGESIAVKSDAYRIVVNNVRLEDVEKIFKKYEDEDIEIFLKLTLPRSSLFKHRFIHVAKRFGILRRKVRYEKINIEKIIDVFKNTIVEKEVFNELFHDKMDIEKTKELFKMIKKGKIKVKKTKGPTPLSKGIIKERFDITKPERLESEIFNTFKSRLMNTKIKLVCVNCGKYQRNYVVKNLPEKPICTKCGSGLLAVTKESDTEAIKIIKKYLSGRDLINAENKKLERLKWSAELVLVYGRKACIALAGKGIGPQTATRILSKMYKTEEDFLKEIYNAEKQFIKTRRYWE